MAIMAKAVYGDPIELKEGEAIHVRLVDVSSDRTGTITQRIDVRTYITTERYTGWSKAGFQTDDPDTLRDLAATLIAAADDAEKRGLKPGNGTTTQTVPVVPVTISKTAARATGVAARKRASTSAPFQPVAKRAARVRKAK
jgi:hypothetical protein